MSDNMVLIMIDECGDEVEVERFTIGDDLDEDYLEMWKSMKEDKARDEYPEARGFYFEDRRNWNRMIYASMRGDWEMGYEDDYDPWEDEEVPVE